MAQACAEVTTAIAFTGRMCAASRFEESQRRDALFVDPLAGKLAGSRGMQQPMGAWILVPRTRFGDDMLRTAYADNGVRQLVLLGAGMDARAFRLPLPELRVFEVDQQTTFDVKEPLIQSDALSVRSRHAVGVDFGDARETWREALLHSGFDPLVPSAWLLEGLVMYLPEATVYQMMRDIGSLSAAGSVVFHDAISASHVATGIRVAGEPFLSGSDDYKGLWARHAGFCKNARAIDFDSIYVNRRKGTVDVDVRRPLVTPSTGQGRKLTIFFQAEK